MDKRQWCATNLHFKILHALTEPQYFMGASWNFTSIKTYFNYILILVILFLLFTLFIEKFKT